MVGQSIFSAQLMERELEFLNILQEVDKNKELPTEEGMYEQAAIRLKRCTLGQLLDRSRKKSIVNEKILERLEKALDKRNLLAHHFFCNRYGWFSNKSKHDIMKTELVETRDMFKKIYDELYEESHRKLRDMVKI